MKHSEQFLKVPVRLYKQRDVIKFEKEQEKEFAENLDHPEYVIGAKYIHYKFFLDPYIITDVFAHPITLEDIFSKIEKFNACILDLGMEDIMVNWNSEKLREKIDGFMLKIDTFLKEEEKEMMNRENEIVISLEEYEKLLQLEKDFLTTNK